MNCLLGRKMEVKVKKSQTFVPRLAQKTKKTLIIPSIILFSKKTRKKSFFLGYLNLLLKKVSLCKSANALAITATALKMSRIVGFRA